MGYSPAHVATGSFGRSILRASSGSLTRWIPRLRFASTIFAPLRPGYEWLLAWRIVRSKKSRFLSLITLVAIVGVALGVMALVIVLSVTGGFQDIFRQRILGLQPHLLVWPRTDEFPDYREAMATLAKDPHVLGATPGTWDEMMVAHGDYRSGAIVKGVDVATVGSVLDVRSLVTAGTLDALDETPVVTVQGQQLTLSNLVQETSVTVVVTEGVTEDAQRALRAFTVIEDPSEPLPDEARLAVTHALPDAGPIDLGLAGTDGTSLAGELSYGATSRGATLTAGPARLRLQPAELTTPPTELDLNGGGSVLLVLGPQPVALTVATSRPAMGEVQVRLVDVRPAGRPPIQLTVEGSPETLTALPGASSGASFAGRPPSILLGAALAERLHARIGDHITLASPFRGLGDRGPAPTGMEPTSGRFEVQGIVSTGYYDYDKRYAVIAFTAAQRFLGSGDKAKWLEVKVDDIFQIDDRQRRVRERLRPYTLSDLLTDLGGHTARIRRVLANDVRQLPVEAQPASVLGAMRNVVNVLSVMRSNAVTQSLDGTDYAIVTWERANEGLFQALKLQKVALTIIFLIVIVVAAFNVVGTQMMLINQKVKEIAILKAMGARRGSVRRVFLIQGLFVSLVGTAIGLVVGVLSCLLLDVVGFPLEPEVYLIDRLPVTMNPAEIALVVVASLALTVLATFYSAGRAARLLPAEGIRYVE